MKIPSNLKKKVLKYLKTHNLGKRGHFDGDLERQYTGLLGECMFHHWLFGEFPALDKEGFDGGFDMMYRGERIDVKTMGRKVDSKVFYANNFVAAQMNHGCDLLVFCSINKVTSRFQMCGYLPKPQFLKKASFHEKGATRKRDDGTDLELRADMFEIGNNHLIDIEYLKF